MDKQDIDKARAAIASTLIVATPIVQALQGADSVFAVLLNAEKHKAALNAEVEALHARVDFLHEAIGTLDKDAAEVASATEAAVLDAQRRVREAAIDADAVVAATTAQVALVMASARAEADIVVRDCAAASAAARDKHAELLAAMDRERVVAETAITALNKKYEALRAQAQKFATTLTE